MNALTGEPPFAGDTMARLIAHTSTPRRLDPRSPEPDVPATFDEVIATGMAKDPDQRYATTVELADAAHDAITRPIRQQVPPPTRPSADVLREARHPTRPAIGQHLALPAAVAPAAATLLDSPPAASRPPAARHPHPATAPLVAPTGHRDPGCPADGGRHRRRRCRSPASSNGTRTAPRSRRPPAPSTTNPHTAPKSR